jgi:nitroreductase
MDAIEVLKTRRSVRSYTNRKVPKEIIKEIINCARFAPTARGEQPWEFIVSKDEKIKSRISKLAPNGLFIKAADTLIAVFCKETKYYLEDGSAATQNILLASHAQGIGACWVAGDKKPYCDEIKKIFGVPDEYKLVSLVSLGYPEITPKLHDKRELNEVLHWERF